MSLLTPLFLAAGILAVALPIVFHLFRRTPRGRMDFSTLMFLAPSPPRLTRRSRLEHWPLLLLRALVLCLLGLAFSRPLLRQFLEPERGSHIGRRSVIVVDASASMRRGDLWTRALRAAEKQIDRAGAYDELALVAFSNRLDPLVTFDAWRAAPVAERATLARAALAELEPTWNATWLDQALVAAAEMLDAADQDRSTSNSQWDKRVVLISDVQTGSRLAGLQSFEWPRRLQVELVALPLKSSNAGVHPLEATEAATSENAASQRPRVLVTNAADSLRDSFELAWQNAPPPVDDKAPAARSVQLYVPPGQTRVVRTPLLPAGKVAQLVLRGDQETFDNTLWFVPTSREQVRVLHLAAEGADDPQSLRYFLERALGTATTGRVVAVESLDPHAPDVRAPTDRDLEDVALVTWAATGELPAAWTDALRRWIERGGIVLAVVERSDNAPWRVLLPESLRAAEHVAVADADKSREYALLSEIDLRHPLFQPLADPRFSDFTKIRFWRHRVLSLDAAAAEQLRVLARFDSGDPALVESPQGAGRVLLLASGWQPRESQLGVSSKFVPLLATLVDLGWRQAPPLASYEAGTVVNLARLGQAEHGDDQPAADKPPRTVGPWTVTTPIGKQVVVAADSPKFTLADGPGVYEVQSSAGLQRLTVDVPADESKTAPMGAEALETLGVRLANETEKAAPTAAERQALQVRELEARQQLWRWCLVAALGCTLMETWYAGRVARRESVG